MKFYTTAMMNKIKIIGLIWVFTVVTVQAQTPLPAKKQTEKIAIINGTLHIGNGEVIEEALVYFENGILIYAGPLDGNSLDKYVVAGVKRVEAKGNHIYPGLIALNTYLGLNEIDAVRATRDYNEVGNFNPNVRALIAYNSESKITPTVRFNGVMLAEVAPIGGRIAGQSAVVQLDAWNWQDASIKADAGIHLNWPVSYRNTGWWAEPGENQRQKWEEDVLELRTFFDEAKNYKSITNPTPINLKYEAMKDVFSGSKKLFIHADDRISITSALDFAKSYGIAPIIVGGADAWMVTAELKQAGASVVITRTQRLPSRVDDAININYALPKILYDSGVLFAIADVHSWEQRNVAFEAGQAVAYGLDKEEAIKSITINAAKILGIDETCGSLLVSKDATIVISQGDILDMKSNNILHAFIQGREIQLANSQRMLYDRYRVKYAK
jgi:imidazolonepropionase-like amidohydrolase